MTVHGYAGDQDRVQGFMPWFQHHGYPVCLFAPVDSPFTFAPTVLLGKRAYIGQDSLDRQKLCLEFLAALPYDYFLLNDSDSVCLSPEIPKFVFEQDVFWSNEVVDPRTHPTPLPRLAFQPPYFMSKGVLLKLVEAAKTVKMHPITQYLDHYMMQLCYAAGVAHKPFNDSNFAHPVKTVEGLQRFRDAVKLQ